MTQTQRNLDVFRVPLSFFRYSKGCRRLEKHQYDGEGQSFASVFWRLLRPHTLTASFVPVVIGSTLAWSVNSFRIELAMAMLFSSMLLQGAVNMFNEYYDYRRGLDNEDSVGIGGAIVRDGMNPEQVFHIAFAFVILALLLGIYIMQQSSWIILPWGLACIAIGYLYSGGPWPISATPLGEIAAGSCMGFGIISIAYFIQTFTVDGKVIMVSVSPSITIGAILMANNIRDLEEDKNHGRKTLAILLGRRKAVLALDFMFLSAYLWIVALVALHQITPWALLVVFSFPKALKAGIGFRHGTRPEELMEPMVATAQANTLFGLLLALGLLIVQI